MNKYKVVASYPTTRIMLDAVTALRRKFGLCLRDAVMLRDKTMPHHIAPCVLPEDDALEVGLCLESAGASVDFEKAWFY